MNAAFPFGLPGPTAMYMTLYIVTFVLHIILMSYVIAGTGYVAVTSALSLRGGERPPDRIAVILRDWLPFGLGAAITAGVAPLLFLQILYKQSFYTANLLLFHRWMAIVPVLIVGFYLLYLTKSERMAGWRPVVRAAVPVGAFLCFLFVAYSWTENHLLAMDDAAWVPHYVEERMVYSSSSILPRVAMWLCVALPALAVIVAWQLWAEHAGDQAADEPHVERLAMVSIAGMVLAVVFALIYRGGIEDRARDAMTGAMAGPYIIALAFGLVLQVGGWAVQWRARKLSGVPLVLVSIGVLDVVIGLAVAREAIRLSSFDTAALFELHERAAGVGGMPLFFGFLIVNTGVIAWCFRITRRGLRESS